uniref:Uncharacterized protein n=1 Tax=Heterorhabditis bacteriophora TaxID=37862 RepID=A0A1I7X8F0_HETBA
MDLLHGYTKLHLIVSHWFKRRFIMTQPQFSKYIYFHRF